MSRPIQPPKPSKPSKPSKRFYPLLLVTCFVLLNALFSLIFYLVSTLLLYLLSGDASGIDKIFNLASSANWSLLVAPLALPPAYYVNKKMGQKLSTRWGSATNKFERYIGISYGVYLLPLLLLFILKLLS